MASNTSTTTTPTAAAATSGGGGGATKKGKMKGKTVDLTEFLNKPINWAEEMEELSLTPADPEHSAGYGGDYTTPNEVRTEIIQKRSQLPTAPKAALSSSVDLGRVPSTAPFSAYIGNVSYDASEDDIVRFFKDLKVLNTRLMREGSRVKGYGYVEFETREDLVAALGMNKQRLLNREVKIDLADRPDEHNQRQQTGGYGTGRGGRQQRSGGYDADKGRDREQETSGDWRMNARVPVGPPSPYDDDRRSQPRTVGPPDRPTQQQGQPGYGYPAPPHGYGPPPYGPQPGYGRRPPVDDYPPQQYPTRPSGYDSDYSGGRGYGSGYDGYPMMRQASYSSQYSGYASDREGTGGGHYRRGQQGGGFYGSMRREYRGGRPPGQHVGGDRYYGAEGYGAPPYEDYQQSYYPEGYGARDSFRQQRSRGGYDNRRGPPQREPYGYDQVSYDGGGAGRRGDERLSSVDTVDSDSSARLKERPRLALQPRSIPPNSVASPTQTDGGDADPSAAGRPRTSVSSAEVFGGARPVDTSVRDREIEEKLRKQEEEFRRQAEERKQSQQQQHPQREHVRKSSSSNFVPERMSNSGRRRTSDSQSSTGGGYQLKGLADTSARKDDEDQANGQVKILQRSSNVPSEATGDSVFELGDTENRQEQSYRRPPQNQNQSFRPAPPPSQNVWTQNRRRGDNRNENQDEASGTLSEPPSSKSVEIQSEETAEDGERENEALTNLSDRERGGDQSKPSETDHELRRPHEEQQDDAVFKTQHPRHSQQYGGHRGRGGRGGRGGGHYYQQHQYHQDPASLPPRFVRERDQQQFSRRTSSQTDDGQEQYSDKRRPSKELVIRRGGQGTLSPATSGRRGGITGPGRPLRQRTGSRERDFPQRGNGRRHPQNQAHQRRGSADSGLPQSQPQDDAQVAQKPPSAPRRQQQPNAPGSRKSSAVPAVVVADAQPVSFESKNKFEMLDMEDD